jgi:hypothetical protein
MSQELSRDERMLYVGLWNEADDAGRFQAHPRRLLGAIFPYEDDLSEQFIERSLRALVQTGRLVLYEADGEPYGELVKFCEHQKPNRPQPSKIPAPDGDSSVIHCTDSEGASQTHDSRTAVVVGEGGVEGSKSPNGDSSETKPPVSEIWGVWVEEFAGTGRPPLLTRKRKQVLLALWREHLRRTDDPVALFRSICHAVKRSDHHMSKREYQYPDSLFRNEERRDRWTQAATGGNGSHWANTL